MRPPSFEPAGPTSHPETDREIDRRPRAGTVERWCWDFVNATDPVHKLSPPAPPASAPIEPAPSGPDSAWEHAPPTRRLTRPGRPEAWSVVRRSPRTPADWTRREARARLVHTFLHHELQAAELFAWAVLAFPDTPRAFRAGLLRLAQEELAHLALYREHLAHLGHAPGDFPVRDWFWERVPTCDSALAFVALQGLGLEGANLEHSERFAAGFRAAGDEAGARILEQVERDEIGHVAFAVKWFEQLAGEPLTYAAWCAALPAPLTPAPFRGHPLNRRARSAAGLDEGFLAALEREPSTTEPRR